VKRLKTVLIFSIAALVVANAAFAQNGRPLTLEECVEMAIRNNSQVLNAERRMHQAGTNVVTARAGILPSINSSFSTGQFQQGDRESKIDVPVEFDPITREPTKYEQRNIIQQGSTRNTNSMSVTAQMTVFDFGQSWNRIRQANASQEASSFSYHSTRQTTIALVHLRYFDHLKAVRLLDVQQEAVKSNEEQLKRTETMYEIGSVAQGDVFRQRTVLGNSRITLINQQNTVANARAGLNVVLGRPASAELAISDVETAGDAKDYTVEEVMKVASEKNPELQGLVKSMRAAELGASVARVNYLPSLGARITYSRDNPLLDKVYSNFGQNYSVNLGASLSFNIFNGFLDQAEVERQNLNYQIAQENLVDRQRNIQLEVERALLAMQAWRDITAINEENLKSANEDLRLAQERYRVGAGTLLDIITAQFNLTNAKATLISAKYEMMSARASLYASMGILGAQ